MSSLFRRSSVRRCTRCTRVAVVVVESDERNQASGACLDHLEWVFLLEVDEWTGRKRTA